MITALAFVVVAAAATLARAELGRRANRSLPVGTFTVNVTGSFLLGLTDGAAPAVVTVLGVGALGAYTTFSSFAREIAALGGQRRILAAAVYAVATVVAGVAAAAVGLAVAPAG